MLHREVSRSSLLSVQYHEVFGRGGRGMRYVFLCDRSLTLHSPPLSTLLSAFPFDSRFFAFSSIRHNLRQLSLAPYCDFVFEIAGCF
jgi:hypothetical protein